MHRDEDDDLSASSSEDTDMSDDEKPKQSNKAPAAAPPKKKKKSKKSQPGRYSQLVIDTIRRLGERNGSSLAKVYNEAKKVPWFDQQNGRTYLRYSIKALVQNDTLLQVKGTGANGSFKLNRRKLEGQGGKKRGEGAAKAASPSAPKGAKPAGTTPKKSHNGAKPAGTTPKKSRKGAKPSSLEKKRSHKGAKPAGTTPKKSHHKGASLAAAKVKKAAKPRVGKV